MHSLRGFIPLLLLMLVAACSSTETIVVDKQARSVEPRTDRQPAAREVLTKIRIGESEPIHSLDPLLARTQSAMRLNGLLYEGLVRVDASGEIKPALAESWEISSDSLVYTFKLHRNAAFNDSPQFVDGKGRRVQSSDVKAAFTRMTSREVPDDAALLFRDLIQGMDAFNREQREVFHASDRSLTDIRGIRTPDSRTVQFVLTQPTKQFLELLASPFAYIVPADLSRNLSERPVGSGPYLLEEKRSDSLFVLRRNTTHWRDADVTMPDIVEYSAYRNPAGLLQALKSGRIDIVPDIAPVNRKQVLHDEGGINTEILPGFKSVRTTSAGYVSLHFNSSNLLRLSGSQGAAILEVLQPDTLRRFLAPVGINEAKRQARATAIGTDIGTIGRIRDGLRPTIGFFHSPYEDYLAKSIAGLGESALSISLVKTGVHSREITWYVRHQPSFTREYYNHPLQADELLRFRVERLTIMHERIHGLQFNQFGWWLNLEGVTLDRSRPT